MARELTYVEPLMVKLEPQLKKRLKKRAVEEGTDMSKMVRALIVKELDRLEYEERKRHRHGSTVVDGMAGRGTSGMTTDEIMALTRGED